MEVLKVSILKNYLSLQFSGFENLLLLDKQKIKKSLYKSILWILITFSIACLSKFELNYLPVTYLRNAAIETIGPHFWNIVVLAGLFLIGLTFLYPKFNFFQESAHNTLAGAHISGLIALGSLISELTFSFPSLFPIFETWRIILIFLALVVSILLIYGLVYSTYYLSQLLISKEIIERIDKLDFRLRFIGFLFFSIMPLVFFLLEK